MSRILGVICWLAGRHIFVRQRCAMCGKRLPYFDEKTGRVVA